MFFVIVPCLIQPAVAQSFVWKISKGQDYFYLGGTMHVLTAKDHPLPIEYQQAYQEADTLVFETDLSAISSPEFQSMMLQAMMYEEGRSLVDELSPRVYQQLSQFLTTRGMQASNLLRVKPWGIALTLTAIEYQRLGMTEEFGVDAYFHQLARQDHKAVSDLETPQEQLTALESMALVEPNQLITYTLRDMKEAATLIDDLKNTWRRGALEELENSPLLLQMQQETPIVYNALMLERNQKWMQTLLSYSDQAGTEFVLVGALHLVGEQGILSLLQQQGFTVQQL